MVSALVLVSWLFFTCFKVRGIMETAVKRVMLRRKVERMALMGVSQ